MPSRRPHMWIHWALCRDLSQSVNKNITIFGARPGYPSSSTITGHRWYYRRYPKGYVFGSMCFLTVLASLRAMTHRTDRTGPNSFGGGDPVSGASSGRGQLPFSALGGMKRQPEVAQPKTRPFFWRGRTRILWRCVWGFLLRV